MTADERRIGACLVGVAAGLLLVGLVSGTPIRHAIQVAPVALAFLCVAKGAPWARYAALPVFISWFAIMLCIWLFLLGMAKVVTGHFSPVEIVLSIAIGVLGLLGIIAVALARTSRVRLAAGAIAFVAFGALQAASIWLSTRPGVSQR